MVLAAVAQIRSTADVTRNVDVCVGIINQASRKGAKVVFLPEASDFITDGVTSAAQLAEPQGGPFTQKIGQAARDGQIYVSIGIHELVPSVPNKCYNSHLLFDITGSVCARYHKLHLFDMYTDGKPALAESAGTVRGTKIIPPVATPVGRVGLSTVGLNDEERMVELKRRGAQILAYPSAFTLKTGAAHWETLLKARAIENQCYVVAAAQAGKHNDKRESYGHAMIVNPWGDVLAQCSNQSEATLAIADIDLSYLDQLAIAMPVMQHQRTDLFPWLAPSDDASD
ncbi:Carbon-nitrogen hydrolase [Tieghemiomyces parasiticus]|uniref:Carbon-nitrogen hydrolase n=1 Tax=Tieghemiomyces parasiticus TaxID=78921 RepID=A0A9W8DU61_9FUNG|nr:Carbon-nitrogen hydrolase [Tieghemiomyces parasiticus]